MGWRWELGSLVLLLLFPAVATDGKQRIPLPWTVKGTDGMDGWLKVCRNWEAKWVLLCVLDGGLHTRLPQEKKERKLRESGSERFPLYFSFFAYCLVYSTKLASQRCYWPPLYTTIGRARFFLRESLFPSAGVFTTRFIIIQVFLFSYFATRTKAAR